jgi:hypothetical protein
MGLPHAVQVPSCFVRFRGTLRTKPDEVSKLSIEPEK